MKPCYVKGFHRVDETTAASSSWTSKTGYLSDCVVMATETPFRTSTADGDYKCSTFSIINNLTHGQNPVLNFSLQNISLSLSHTLFNGGDTLDPNCYRPISILPCTVQPYSSTWPRLLTLSITPFLSAESAALVSQMIASPGSPTTSLIEFSVSNRRACCPDLWQSLWGCHRVKFSGRLSSLYTSMMSHLLLVIL